MEYNLPCGNKVRVIESTPYASLRASFTHADGKSPVNFFTGKPVHPPKGTPPDLWQNYIRKRTHVELFND